MSAVPQPLRMMPATAEGAAAESNEGNGQPEIAGDVVLARFAGLNAEEANLIALVQRGDAAAFAQLVQLHQRLVLGFLRARLLQSADAEDLCQDVFLRCYQGREKLERAASLASWLVGIARNRLREYVRRQSRRKDVAWTELCLELDRLTEANTEGGDEALAHLPACLQTLGPSAREAIELYYRDHQKMARIGVLLKRSEGAVKLLIHRSRLALRNCLEHKLRKTND